MFGAMVVTCSCEAVLASPSLGCFMVTEHSGPSFGRMKFIFLGPFSVRLGGGDFKNSVSLE